MTDETSQPPNDRPATPMASTGEIAAVVQKVQRSHRGRIRWGIGQHTAELALRALRGPRREARRPTPKSRRRKRHKRML